MENTLGIHINLPSQLVLSIKKAKDRVGLEYWGNYNFDPHITLYLSRFSRKNFSKLVSGLTNLSVRPFKLRISSVMFAQEEGGVFCYLSVARSVNLLKLHKLVVNSANGLRENLLRQKDVFKIKKGYYNATQEGYIKKYGYLRVLKFFNPHVTLGQVANNEFDKKKFRDLFIIFRNRIIEVNSLTVGLYSYDNKKGIYRKEILSRSISL
ncbi:MAG: 2'-5' RNA ligase family protein [Patescibacteria group bacterium]